MKWQHLVGSGFVAAGLSGCITGQSASLLAANPGLDARAVQRLQQADVAEARQTVQQTALATTPAGASATPQGRKAATILATVNNVAILEDEVRIQALPFLVRLMNVPEPERSRRQAAVLNDALQHLIEREVVLHEALWRLKNPAGQKYLDKIKEAANKEFDRKLRQIKGTVKAETDEELKAYFQAQGISLEIWRRQFERDFLMSQYMRSRIEPVAERGTGHQQLLEYYNSHPEEFQSFDAVHWLDIFVDVSKYPNREAARQFAELLARRAQEGEDFVQLATQYDNGDSRYRKAEGVGRRRGEIRPSEAEPILFALKAGQVGPLIELGNGFPVVKVVKREHAGRHPFDEKTQEQIRTKLRSEVTEREWKRIVADLKQKAVIEYAVPVQQK